MRAIALKMRAYTRGVSIVNNNNMGRRTLQILLFSLGALGLFYVLLLGTMVFNIVGRKTAEAQSRSLSNEVSALELQYLSMSNKIDLSLSHSLGFTETKTTFATRHALGIVKIDKNEI